MMAFHSTTKDGRMRLMSLSALLAFGYLAQGVETSKALLLEGVGNGYQALKYHLDELVAEGYVERSKLQHTSGYSYSLHFH